MVYMMRVRSRTMTMVKLDTVDDVFVAFGGPTAIARLLDLKGASTASEMRRRRSIPVEYWRRLVELAADNGAPGLTYDKLVTMHSKPATAASEREKQTS